MKGYKLTRLGKSLVSGLIIVLLFVGVTVFFLVAGTSGGQGGPQAITPPPTISESPPSNGGGDINSQETEEPSNGANNGGNGYIENGGYDDVNGIDAPPDQDNENNNGDELNITEEIEDPTEINGTEEPGEENGSEEYEEPTDQPDSPAPLPPPSFDQETGALTVYIPSNSDGNLDFQTRASIDTFLSLPQNNPDNMILITTPLLEIDELTDLSRTMTNALVERGVPHERIVFVTNANNARTQNPTFEVTLSFLPIVRK